MPETFKIAFVGTHGVGKTTLCYALAARLKARDVILDVVEEVARRSPLPINRDTTIAAQSWILHTQIADELVAANRHDVVICDRSVLDNYVYLLLAAGKQPVLEGLVDGWMKSYSLLIHVPIVDRPQADGMRSTEPAFQRSVDQRLLEEVTSRNLEVLRLPRGDRGSWVDAVETSVLACLGPSQLQLL